MRSACAMHGRGLLAAPGHDDEVHVVGRERGRPREPVLVVVLLDDRGDDARHADAVAAHHHRVLLAVLVGVVRVERLAVLGAELEHVPDLDAAVDRQRLAAAGARVARHDRHEVGPHVDVEVAAEHRVPRVVIDSFAPGDPAEPAQRTLGSATTTLTCSLCTPM